MKRSKKKFLKRPEYPGGKEAFKKYIKENLRYPEEALQKRIEGTIQLMAEIDDNGNVGEVSIEKGLGYGCDEEAVRLIKNVQFGGVKNRGVRLKSKKKFRIEFKLPPQTKQKTSYNYSYNKTQDTKPKENLPNKKPGYSYTIKLPN